MRSIEFKVIGVNYRAYKYLKELKDFCGEYREDVFQQETDYNGKVFNVHMHVLFVKITTKMNGVCSSVAESLRKGDDWFVVTY